MEQFNVLSVCDGMSCGQIALQELNIKVDNYFASEIDKSAIKVTRHNFPNTFCGFKQLPIKLPKLLI